MRAFDVPSTSPSLRAFSIIPRLIYIGPPGKANALIPCVAVDPIVAHDDQMSRARTSRLTLVRVYRRFMYEPVRSVP